jgi:hypothetical protein
MADNPAMIKRIPEIFIYAPVSRPTVSSPFTQRRALAVCASLRLLNLGYASPPAWFLSEPHSFAILRCNCLILFASGFMAASLLRGGVIIGGANRILRLANSRLNFALDLLSGASHLGSGVAGQAAYLPLCVTHHFVDCAFYSLLVHKFTS